LRIEIFHVISFLLMFATRQWTHSKDQVTWSGHQSALHIPGPPDWTDHTDARRLFKPD